MTQSIKQHIFKKGARLRIPVSGTFELTPRCNLNCKMCYVHMTAQEQQMSGKELTTQEWIELGKQAVNAGMIFLLLTGGEPLLRTDFKEIYTELIKLGLRISINTNGTLITPELVELFYFHRPEKINITLYGMSSGTYGNLCGNVSGFQSAVDGIRNLKKAGICVTINTTFTSINQQDMEEIIRFAKTENIPIRTAAFTFPPVRNAHEKQKINLSPEEAGRLLARFDKLTMRTEALEKRKKHIENNMKFMPSTNIPESKASSCMAARGAFWVTWDGFLLPCGMLPGHAVSIAQNSFQDAWSILVKNQPILYIPAGCSGCKFRNICPICSAVAESLCCGKDEVPKEMCRFTESYAEAILSL